MSSTDGGWGTPPVAPRPGPPQNVPSYQSPPMGGPLVPPARRRNGLLIVGISLVVGSLVVAAVLLVLAGVQRIAAVEDLARAPAGCVTALEVDRTGTLYVYAERTGTIGALEGDCSSDDREYDLDAVPPVSVILVDDDDDEVDLEDVDGPEYDTGDHVGEAVQSVRIDAPGTYRIIVESSEADAVVAVGPDVSEVGGLLGLVAVAIGLVGVLVGAVLATIGARRRRTPRSAPPPGDPWGRPPRPVLHTLPGTGAGGPGPMPAGPPPMGPPSGTGPAGWAPPPPPN